MTKINILEELFLDDSPVADITLHLTTEQLREVANWNFLCYKPAAEQAIAILSGEISLTHDQAKAISETLTRETDDQFEIPGLYDSIHAQLDEQLKEDA